MPQNDFGNKKDENVRKYDDIIGLPHHVSLTRARMPLRDRAAQFSPFAALTGYDAEISETARLTGERLETDDDRNNELNRRINLLIEYAAERPTVAVTYFLADGKKSGGAYVTKEGCFRRLDESVNEIIMTDGTAIPTADIYFIDGEIFRILDGDEE